MSKQNYLLAVFIASVYLIIAVQSVKLPPNIPKCKPNDGACISNILTQLFQNSREHPELNILDLKSYQPQQSWTTQTRGYDLLKLISYSGHASDISMYGLDKLQIHPITEMGSHSNFTGFSSEILIPWLKYNSNFKADVEMLSLLGFPASGKVTAEMTSLRFPLHAKTEVIERNGEQYLQIKSIDLSIRFMGDFKMDMKFDTLAPGIVQNVINEQANCNWKQFTSQFETDFAKYCSEIVYQALAPPLAKVPMKNIFIF